MRSDLIVLNEEVALYYDTMDAQVRRLLKGCHVTTYQYVATVSRSSFAAVQNSSGQIERSTFYMLVFLHNFLYYVLYVIRRAKQYRVIPSVFVPCKGSLQCQVQATCGYPQHIDIVMLLEPISLCVDCAQRMYQQGTVFYSLLH